MPYKDPANHAAAQRRYRKRLKDRPREPREHPTLSLQWVNSVARRMHVRTTIVLRIIRDLETAGYMNSGMINFQLI